MTTQRARLTAGPRVLAAEDPNTISVAASILLNGGVVAIPTDTVYGLSASIRRPDAIHRLYDLKSRSPGKAIPILLSDYETVGQVAKQAPAVMTKLAERFWPGALTLVVEALEWLPDQVASTDVEGRRTVAVRLPNHLMARRIIDAAGGALAVTSANRSGEMAAIDARQVRQLAIEEPDAIVDGGSAAWGVPSTIVSIVGSTITILREGAIPASEILAFLRRSGYGAGALRDSAV